MFQPRLATRLLLTLMGCLAAFSGSAEAASNVIRVRLGNPQDVSPTLYGPSYYLQGNGSPLKSAFQAHVDVLVTAPLDVVVLAESLPSAGNSITAECDAIMALRNINSCETITLLNAAAANDVGAATAVAAAEALYFSGGDQCDYVVWKGSAVYNAVNSVVARKGGVGGGSAGLAIQGQYVYDGCKGSVDSSTALSNPYNLEMSFTYGYFAWNPLARFITDSHFVARDRMGRLMSFLARQIKDGITPEAYGLGVEEGAGVVVDANGLGTVYGTGPAYVVYASHAPEQCTARKPLTYTNYSITKLPPGARYNFSTRSPSSAYQRSVISGSIIGDPYSP